MKALPRALSYDELYRLIEKALVENDAYDVAKSLVISRSSDGTGDYDRKRKLPSVLGQIRILGEAGKLFHGIQPK